MWNKIRKHGIKKSLIIAFKKTCCFVVIFFKKILNVWYGKNVILIKSSINPLVHNWGDDASAKLIQLLVPDKKIIPTLYYWNFYNLPEYLCIGSIISWMTTPNSIIWGAGVVYPEQEIPAKPLKVLAVRGPLTRNYLLRHGISCPAIYGDPAILFPYLYFPKHYTKTYKLGVIPHMRDKKNDIFKQISRENEIHYIDVQNIKNWKSLIDEILQCDFIISSSLHGIILADAYSVPNLWIEFENGESKRFAFNDYYHSVSMTNKEPYVIFKENNLDDIFCHKKDWIKPIIDISPLISVCPFQTLKLK